MGTLAQELTMKKKDRPLTVEVTKHELVIRIGINTLAFSAENCPRFYDGTVENADPPYVTILDNRQLAHDVCRELLSEAEDGSSPLSDVLDECIEAARDDGSEAFDYE